MGESSERGVVWLEWPGVEPEVMASGLWVFDGWIAGDLCWDLAGAKVCDGFVLPMANHVHVVDAIGVAFDVPVHHRCGGEHAQRVGGVHDFEPGVHVALAHADFGADCGREDFAAAAGE